MKILLVNKFLYPNGGSETYIFELGKELLRQGHEVQYFGMYSMDERRSYMSDICYICWNCMFEIDG